MKQRECTHPIGGYFELELPRFTEYHSEAIALNSGRFCLEYILRCRKYTEHLLYDFREDIQKFFSLKKIPDVVWESTKKEFVEKVKSV